MSILTGDLELSGNFMISKGISAGDMVPAAQVHALLTEYRELSSAEIREAFSEYWKKNITHAFEKS